MRGGEMTRMGSGEPCGGDENILKLDSGDRCMTL